MKYGLVVIGASLGGLHALRAALSALPADFALPLGVAQHRTADAGNALCAVLQKDCALELKEAADKLPIAPGVVAVAPSGYHLLVEEDHWALSTEGPVEHARPSIDMLFESAAEAFGRRVVGVVLSGTGSDGAAGLAAIVGRGGLALAESPATAYASAMPQAALDQTPGITVLGLEDIGPRLAALGRMG